MSATAYHLEARSPFHFGLRGVGIEATAVAAPSDTVFSALCHAIRQQFGLEALDDFLGSYDDGRPAVVLSSAFPYVPARREDQVDDWQPPDPLAPDQAVRFYPRPLDSPPRVPDDPARRKTIKRISWVSEAIFRTWVGGGDLAGHLADGNLVQGDRVWLTREERDRVAGWRDEETDAIRLWSAGDAPRVTVDRRASTSQVYQAGRVWFQPGGGIWLFARWRDDWEERGRIALQVLGDEGMGGERSAGHGQFKPHGPHLLPPLPHPVPGERFVTLSLYYPTRDELPQVLDSSGVHYQFQVRRGWMSSPDVTDSPDGTVARGGALRRKSVRMFAEASLLRWPAGRTALGGLADVTPEGFRAHTVWRYGLAFPVGYRAGERGDSHE